MKFINKDLTTKRKLDFLRIIYYRVKSIAARFKKINNKIVIDRDEILLISENSEWVLGKITRIIYESLLNRNYKTKIIRKSELNYHAGYIFFDHYLPLISAYENRQIVIENSFLWFTHPRSHVYSDRHVLEILIKCKKIFCQGFHYAEMFKKYGFTNVVFYPGGVDERFNYPNNKGIRNSILISSNYYKRKNPELYKRIIESKKEYTFHVIGKGWNSLENYKNVIIYENVEYSDYVSIYNKANIFLSLSKVEGGPLSLLEAINFGFNIISSNTGVAGYLKQIKNVCITESEEIHIVGALIDFMNVEPIQFFSFLSWTRFGEDISEEIRKSIIS